MTCPACAAENRDGAGRTGAWTTRRASCHYEQALRLTTAVFFFVDDETAEGPFPAVRRLGPGAGLIASDVRNVNQRSMRCVEGVSP